MENQPRELNERERLILQAVVHSYITTAEPAGSRALVKRFNLDISPATVRNVMADLEDLGYLQQIHTSSGRVPTDRGYRYYVDYLMQVQEVTLQERAQIEAELNRQLNDANAVLRHTSQLLALVTHQTGVVEAPHEEDATARHIELLPMGGDRVAVLVVDTLGRVRSLTVSVERPLEEREMQLLNRFLNEQLRGVRLGSLSQELTARIGAYLEEQRQLAMRALEVLRLLPPQQPVRLFLEGASSLFDQPEFQDIDKARVVFGLFEEQEKLIGMLRNVAQSEVPARGSRILIGGEGLGGGLDGLSVVAAPYEVEGRTAGAIGVIGPRRMPYHRLTGIVDYTAEIMGRLLTRLSR